LKKNIEKRNSIISEELTISDLNKGLYFIIVESNEYKSVNKIIVK
jgi:CRISPR/Cas system CSM-associated protein Csm4 (group 5 of RAMP superfamily)